MPLNTEELTNSKIVKDLKKIAKVQHKTLEEIIALYNPILDEIADIPKLKGKSRRMILNRAKSALNVKLNNTSQPGDPFILIPFGPLGDVKDWNQDLFEHIVGETGRPNIKGLVAEGRIMYMLVDGKRVPVSEIIEKEVLNRFIDVDTDTLYDEQNAEGTLKPIKETIITNGKEWKKGLPVIPRDHRTLSFNNANYGYSEELSHKLEQTLVGFGYFESDPNDLRLIDIKLRNDQADKNSKNFFFSKHEMFRPYIGNFEIDEKKTDAWRFVLKGYRVTLRPHEIVLKDGMSAAIEDMFMFLHNKYGNGINEVTGKTGDGSLYKKVIGQGTDQIPDFLDGYSDLAEYHTGRDEDGEKSEYFNGAVKRTSSGNVIRGATNWDKVHWNKYFIMQVSVTNVIEPQNPETSSTRIALSDAAVGKNITVWLNDYITKLPRPIPSTCLIMGTTSRKPNRYDPTTKKRVDDLVNGEIIINIKSITTISEIDTPTVEDAEGI